MGELAVIGAGFGGLGAALRAQERGERVVLYEALNYPGGCASTFTHRGYRFEAGATLFSGFDPHQPFGRWIEELGLDVTFDRLDPLVELRTPSGSLAVCRDRAEFADRLCAWAGEQEGRVRRFLRYQEKIAEVLWSLFEEPTRLPPWSFGTAFGHVLRTPRYLRLVRSVGRSLEQVLERFGLADCRPLRIYLDAVCQITIQVDSARAEAPFALAAMDYFWRGTGHVRGGIGVLAEALVDAIEQRGGQVRFTDRVRSLERRPHGWRVHARRGARDVDRIAANLLPQDLQRLLGQPQQALQPWAERVRTGWGACMLYRVVTPPPDAGAEPRHLQLIQDERQPFHSGNHLFVSISGAHDGTRAPLGQRTLTVSTHAPLGAWQQLAPAALAAKVQAVQDRMRRGLARLAPEWESAVSFETTASPRTFARFTGRSQGWVGGIPRSAGWQAYRELWRGPVAPGLALVGDSAFPGQSTLAAAIGGHRAVDRLLRGAPRRRERAYSSLEGTLAPGSSGPSTPMSQ